jgi:hypothetical protein
MRIPAIGDKMASRSGQKGTIGMIIPEEDMPFTKDGIRPDIIVNPHAIPTRMTIGQLVECITGKACVIQGTFGDATAFNNKGTKISQFAEILTKHKYHSSGNEILYNGMTGEQIETDIFIGPTFYMRLKHMVKDKINYRTQGPRTALTRQPVGGRANDGGLRIGEMERDVLISHGAANMLTESMMERGDKYYMAVCNKTGMIAVYNPDKNLFLSPMADGPLKFTGSIAEGNMAVENVTRFGRDFSVVRIPYSFKLLIQELQCANVAMRIITDDNIEQIENMSFSKNVNILLNQPEVSMKEYIDVLKQKGKASGFRTEIKAVYERDESPDIQPPPPIEPTVTYIPSPRPKDSNGKYLPRTPDESPQYVPRTPDESPQYVPRTPDESPQYVPRTPDESPQYAPNETEFESPQYPTDDSIKYAPDESPQYPPESIEEMKGGTRKPQLTKGDIVYLKTTREPCKIEKMGSEFITLEGQDGSIHVVEPYEITDRPTIHMPTREQPVFNGQSDDKSQQTPNITVNVINGNGNSADLNTNENEPKNKREPKKGGAEPEPEISNPSNELSPHVIIKKLG